MIVAGKTVRLASTLAASLLLAACAGEKVWMRSGASSVDAESDELSCAVDAENPGISVNVGGGAGVPSDRFSNRYACLRSKGYKLKSLTAEESAKLKSLGGAQREAYWDELLRKNGFAPPRQEPAAAPASPLPAARGAASAQ